MKKWSGVEFVCLWYIWCIGFHNLNMYTAICILVYSLCFLQYFLFYQISPCLTNTSIPVSALERHFCCCYKIKPEQFDVEILFSSLTKIVRMCDTILVKWTKSLTCGETASQLRTGNPISKGLKDHAHMVDRGGTFGKDHNLKTWLLSVEVSTWACSGLGTVHVLTTCPRQPCALEIMY